MKRLLTYALAGVLAAPSAAFGQDAAAPKTADTAAQDEANSVVESWGGTTLGPYAGELVSDPTQPAFTLYRVDYEHEAQPAPAGTAQAAATAPRASGDDGRAVGFGTYWTSGYLASLLIAWGTPSSSPTHPVTARGGQPTVGYSFDGPTAPRSTSYAWSGIHAATWTLKSTAPPYFPAGGGLARAFGEYAGELGVTHGTPGGMAGFVGGPFPSMETLESGGPTQQAIGRTTVTPEPQTWVMLGTGMLLLFGIIRKKKIREIGDM